MGTVRRGEADLIVNPVPRALVDEQRNVAVERVREKRQLGAGTLEYVGAIVAAGVLIIGLALVFPSAGERVSCKVSQVIATITGGSAECSGGSTDDEGSEGGKDDGKEEQSRPADVPDGLDPDSDLVQVMQSTERGRQALQWLFDNDVEIVVDPTERGAWWDGTRIVLGGGYDDAAVLIHEVNHAKYSKEGRSADARKLSRDDYVGGMIAEESDGVVQQIQAAREFRAAGHNVRTQPGEAEYDAAYQKAKDAGASDADAAQAGYDAIVQKFYDKGPNGFRGSSSGKSYPDHYGGYWDSIH